MKILSKACGDYQTNCYIVKVDGKDFIIDPGIGATKWVMENVENPKAILNTHGHFDHVWSNSELKEKLEIPIYAPEGDEFLLKDDQHGFNMPSSTADFKIKGDKVINIDGVDFKFALFAGHTPGCSIIEIDGNIFSGDFIFAGSIGRVDFPYSNPNDMKNSIKKFLKRDDNAKIYPGHGGSTTVKKEQGGLKRWLDFI